MRILSESEDDDALAAASLSSGKLVAFPMETVCCMGANACNLLVLARMFETKRRPAFVS